MKKMILKTLWRVFMILLGSVIAAAGITYLIQPHKLLTGGVTGTSILLSYFTPIEPGIWIALFNIPLFIVAWRKIDFRFAIYSVIGVASLSGALIFMQNFSHPWLSVSDPLLAALFGGMLSGGGTGLVIRARASHGGTDIISVILRRKYSLSLGTVSFYINLIIVAILSLRYGLELGLLTLFSQFVSSKALDRVVTGLNTAKAVTIVSDKADEISEYITRKMYRGLTLLDGQGAYSHKHKRVIWCIVTTSQLSRVKGAMKKIDPNAFMAISDASEIIGEGFYRSPF